MFNAISAKQIRSLISHRHSPTAMSSKTMAEINSWECTAMSFSQANPQFFLLVLYSSSFRTVTFLTSQKEKSHWRTSSRAFSPSLAAFCYAYKPQLNADANISNSFSLKYLLVTGLAIFDVVILLKWNLKFHLSFKRGSKFPRKLLQIL